MASTPIRASAKGEACTARVPGVCNGNNETVVLAHRNGGGMGMKQPDYQGAYCCSACHTFFDGGWTRTHYRESKSTVLVMFYEAILRTQEKLILKGLITVKGDERATGSFKQMARKASANTRRSSQAIS